MIFFLQTYNSYNNIILYLFIIAYFKQLCITFINFIQLYCKNLMLLSFLILLILLEKEDVSL